MKIKPLEVGQPHPNLEFYSKLTRYSHKEGAMTNKAIKLLKANYWPKSSSNVANSILAQLGRQSTTASSRAQAQIKIKATALESKLPVIEKILQKQGIPGSAEITFQLEKAIRRAINQSPANSE